MRKFSKHKRGKQRNVLIIGSLSLLLFLCIGYAAFSTNLSFKARGNIKCKSMGVSELKESVVTSGEGLYLDSYENNRYIYKGSNPNNYVTFNNELWRILAIEKDDVIKMVKATDIGSRPFDSVSGEDTGRRYNDDNTYCKHLYSDKYLGCNAWQAVDGTFTNGNKSGTVSLNSELNDYLNNEYFLSLDGSDLILDYKFYNGGLLFNSSGAVSSLSQIFEDEKKSEWIGKVGIIGASDYLKASLNLSCTDGTNPWRNTGTNECVKENYLYQGKGFWLFSPIIDHTDNVADVEDSGLLGAPTANVKSLSVYPVVNLKSTVSLCGNGTMANPYLVR